MYRGLCVHRVTPAMAACPWVVLPSALVDSSIRVIEIEVLVQVEVKHQYFPMQRRPRPLNSQSARSVLISDEELLSLNKGVQLQWCGATQSGRAPIFKTTSSLVWICHLKDACSSFDALTSIFSLRRGQKWIFFKEPWKNGSLMHHFWSHEEPFQPGFFKEPFP